MSFACWPGLRRLRPSPAMATRHRRQSQFRLYVETLEQRCLLSTDLSATLVADIVSGTASSNPQHLVNANGTLFFYAPVPTSPIPGQLGLWKSDGTTAGTVSVKDQLCNADAPPLDGLVAIGSTVFFNSCGEGGFTNLWKSDGTTAGTVSVKQLGAANMTAVGEKLFFSAYGDKGNELWVSDGSETGTKVVKDIYGGSHQECSLGGSTRKPRIVCYQVANDSNPSALTDVNGTLFFTAFDGTGRYLWKSDGTSGGTKIVKQVGAGNLTNVNGVLFFSGPGGLWKSDGSAAGTVLVKAVNATHLIHVNGTLFFQGEEAATGAELWKSDGSDVGTVLVKDIVPGNAGSVFTSLASANRTLYVSVNDGIHGAELWKSDGSTSGTVLVKDIQPGANSGSPSELTNVNGLLYFTADDATNGQELWQSDGTTAGTSMVEDIYPGSAGSNPSGLVAMNDKLYFAATDPEHGRELWDPPPVRPPGSAGSYLFVADYDKHSILRFDSATGALVDAVVPNHSNGLHEPLFAILGPQDHNLYVGSGHFNPSDHAKGVLRYNSSTGAFIDTFTENDRLDSVHGLIFGPDGDLYVGDWAGGFQQRLGGRILRFDGTTGAFVAVLQ